LPRGKPVAKQNGMFNIGSVQGMASWRPGFAESAKNRLITGRIVLCYVAEAGSFFRQRLAGFAHAAKKTTR